jgi:hypothetical protein
LSSGLPIVKITENIGNKIRCGNRLLDFLNQRSQIYIVLTTTSTIKATAIATTSTTATATATATIV